MTGEELYDCIYDALEDGKIGTVTIPWRDVPSAERQVWSRIAGDARAEALSRIRHPSALPLADDDSEAQAEASERIARFLDGPVDLGFPAPGYMRPASSDQSDDSGTPGSPG